MTSDMPDIAVPPQIEEVVRELASEHGENLRAVLWHGSRARGEAQAGSDEDLILLFHEVDDGVLLRLRHTFLEAGRIGWSTYILSDAEYRQVPADRRNYFAIGSRLLYGEFEFVQLSQADLLAHLRSRCREILYQCRDRLINKKHALPTIHRMAKFAVFLTKIRHLYLHGTYPLTRAELLDVVDDQEARQIIEWVERWDDVPPQLEDDITPLILTIDSYVRRLVASLPDPEEDA
jgi:hypothetical protein